LHLTADLWKPRDNEFKHFLPGVAIRR
jgi:hypothetical protein